MSKHPPELTWQDKAILIVIPIVVFAVFLLANYLSKDLTIAEAFANKMPKTIIRDAGSITELIPADPTATATQLCRLRSREGDVDFTFRYNVQGTATMNLQIGRIVQFFGEYKYDAKGGVVEVPFKGKSGRITGHAVYENRRYFGHGDEQKGDL